ncbi:MAG: uroporphyrinogen decarboxylase family protein [Thermoproteota archaeon]
MPHVANGFEHHNEMVSYLWKDFKLNKHERIPVTWGMNNRMIILNKELNVKNYTYEKIFNDPETMLQVELEFEYWRRHNVYADWEMGLPGEWSLPVHFQNVYESAWFGAPLYFSNNSVPDIVPFLKNEDDLRAFMKKGMPEPFSGFMARVRNFYEYFLKRKEEGYTYFERPIGSISAPIGTDGPFTVATNITGGYVVKLLYRNRSLAEEFLWFMTESIVERMKAWHRLLKISFPYEGFGFADDSIQLLSPKVYREFILPLHKKIVSTFCLGRPSIHLCGAVIQHLETLREELNISSIDTGFPLDLGKAREILGEDVVIQGGVRVTTLKQGPLNKIEEEVKNILDSGVTKGKRFVFRDANNVAPKTPIEHLNFTYQLVKRIGRYEED